MPFSIATVKAVQYIGDFQVQIFINVTDNNKKHKPLLTLRFRVSRDCSLQGSDSTFQVFTHYPTIVKHGVKLIEVILCIGLKKRQPVYLTEILTMYSMSKKYENPIPQV